MTDDEMELIPFGYLKKHDTFVNKLEEHETLQRESESRSFKNRWEEVKSLVKLRTNQEKETDRKFIEENWKQGENVKGDIEWVDYMKRQPRLNLGKKNFNFEEY